MGDTGGAGLSGRRSSLPSLARADCSIWRPAGREMPYRCSASFVPS